MFGVNGSLALQEENKNAGNQDVSRPEAFDVDDSKPVCRCSTRLLKCGHNENDADAEKQRKLETLIPCRITPLNSPSSVPSFFKKDFIVSKIQAEANGTSESEKEVAGVRTETRSELNVGNVSSLNVSKPSAPVPDMRRNQEMQNDKTSDQKMEMADANAKAGLDNQTVPENTPVACNIKSSAADDLDEMMDIGTVDQADQEAQMKIEDPPNSDTTCSPASSNPGELHFVCQTAEYSNSAGLLLVTIKNVYNMLSVDFPAHLHSFH